MEVLANGGNPITIYICVSDQHIVHLKLCYVNYTSTSKRGIKGYILKILFFHPYPLTTQLFSPEENTVSMGYIRLIYMKLAVFDYFDMQQRQFHVVQTSISGKKKDSCLHRIFIPVGHVLVYYCSVTNYLKIQWLETTNIYCLTVFASHEFGSGFAGGSGSVSHEIVVSMLTGASGI